MRTRALSNQLRRLEARLAERLRYAKPKDESYRFTLEDRCAGLSRLYQILAVRGYPIPADTVRAAAEFQEVIVASASVLITTASTASAIARRRADSSTAESNTPRVYQPLADELEGWVTAASTRSSCGDVNGFDKRGAPVSRMRCCASAIAV